MSPSRTGFRRRRPGHGLRVTLPPLVRIETSAMDVTGVIDDSFASRVGRSFAAACPPMSLAELRVMLLCQVLR
jgi:hypothetical protein